MTYDFKLKKAPSLTGAVLDSEGRPLTDTIVYLATADLNVTDRKVTYSRESRTATTDASGHFEFAPEVEPFCLVVVHEQGIEMVTETQFASSDRIYLQPWTEKNKSRQIIRRPAPGQSVDFPVKFP